MKRCSSAGEAKGEEKVTELENARLERVEVAEEPPRKGRETFGMLRDET